MMRLSESMQLVNLVYLRRVWLATSGQPVEALAVIAGKLKDDIKLAHDWLVVNVPTDDHYVLDQAAIDAAAAAEAAATTAAIAESKAVNAWLVYLAATSPEQFAALRVLSYAEQLAAWVAAGSPVV